MLTGELTIIGMTQDMNNLVTITAKATNRHFKLEASGHKLTLWHLKLTGGDISNGGSILISFGGKLNLYYSELSGNNGSNGGAIKAEANNRWECCC